MRTLIRYIIIFEFVGCWNIYMDWRSEWKMESDKIEGGIVFAAGWRSFEISTAIDRNWKLKYAVVPWIEWLYQWYRFGSYIYDVKKRVIVNPSHFPRKVTRQKKRLFYVSVWFSMILFLLSISSLYDSVEVPVGHVP